ncbi:MAG: hypothetical protein IT185_12605, partial [Acidobacteria bacterium]|nr:hypothetical protein [Acidobacteriota bacterium]
HRMGLTYQWGKTEEEARKEAVDPYTRQMQEKVKTFIGPAPMPKDLQAQNSEHEKD